MAETYSFDEQTQVRLLSLLKSHTLGPEHIHPSYFVNPILATMCEALTAITNVQSPTKQMVLYEMKSRLGDLTREYLPDIKRYITHLFVPVPESHLTYYTELASEFAEYVLYRRSIQDSIELLRTNDPRSVKRLREKWTQVVNTTFATDNDLGLDYFATAAERIRKRLETPDVLKTLIPELDDRLSYGGIARGELILFAGSPSSGKSLALQHVAKAAVLQRKKVLFFSLEMNYDRIGDRLDAAWTGIPMRELANQSALVSQRMQKVATLYQDQLRIKRFPAYAVKVSTLKRFMETLSRQDFIPDLMVVDYINLLAPERISNARYEDLGQTYLDLRALGEEFNVYNVTAAQGNRGSTKTELFSMADLAESFSGSAHSDIIVSINRSEDDKRQQRLRLYLAKNRSDIDGIVLSLYSNFGSGQFYRRRT